jgi:hypothetical protein
MSIKCQHMCAARSKQKARWIAVVVVYRPVAYPPLCVVLVMVALCAGGRAACWRMAHTRALSMPRSSLRAVCTKCSERSSSMPGCSDGIRSTSLTLSSQRLQDVHALYAGGHLVNAQLARSTGT